MRRPMSQLNRNLFSTREEERLLKRALGCAIPEFIARFGAADAVKRVELELRRARRARSRRLYAFWSAVLAQIATPTKRVQSGSESKCADRSIAPSGLCPTKALNSEGGRFRLDRNTGRRRLSAIAGEVLVGVSAARATFGRKQAKDLRNPRCAGSEITNAPRHRPVAGFILVITVPSGGVVSHVAKKLGPLR